MFNVGLHATLVQFEKILKGNAIEYKKAKKTPAVPHGVLTFEVHGNILPDCLENPWLQVARAKYCVESLLPVPVH